ncbi:MAG TPA: AraC family transcriptional regulator [Polyangiaceae bacterium]
MAACERALYQRFLPEHGRQSYVWKYSQSIGGRRPRHFHAEPELNLVVRGSARFGVGDRMLLVSEGELVAFPSGQDHALLEGSADLYLYAIGLDAAYSGHVLGAEREPPGPLHARLEGRERAEVFERAASIVDRAGAEQLGAELWERVHWLGQRSAERLGRPAHVLTRRALQLMTRAPELGPGALAAEFGVHQSELSRYFHRDTGVTLVHHRARLRVLELIRLVNRGEHDLMVAASAAGFGSYSQCHRTFRSEFGCSPREFFFSGLRERMQLAYLG